MHIIQEMPLFPKSQDHLPLNWWRGQPVYLAAYVAIGVLASMVATAVLLAVNPDWFSYLIFSSYGFLHLGRVWTAATYVLFNPPDFWLLVTCYFLWRFGEELEKFFGRRVFVRMLVIFALAAPAMLLLVGLIWPMDWRAVGINSMQYGVFLAFVTLYPRARVSLILFSLEAWAIAALMIGVNVLIALSHRFWAGLVIVIGEALVAYALVRYEQGAWSFRTLLPKLRSRLTRRSKPQLQIVRRSREDPIPSSPDLDVDTILDKIGKHGLESLTPEERRTLEKASKDLRGRN